MIDFVTLEIKCDWEKLLRNPNLDFTSTVSENTGEVKHRYGYFYRRAYIGEKLTILIASNIFNNDVTIVLKGSIHKHAHGNSNYSNFTFVQLSETINQICQILDVTPEQCILRGFEFGVNISPVEPAINVLESILTHSRKLGNTTFYEDGGCMKEFKFKQFDLKIYDKGAHAKLLQNILRIEIRARKMQYLNGKGINVYTAADLLKPENYTGLERLLISCIKNLYFFDHRISINSINNRPERDILIAGSNPNYWKRYRIEHTSKGHQKKVKRFRELVLKYAPTDLQTDLKNMVIERWNELLNSYPLLPHVGNPIVTQNYPLLAGNNSKPTIRYCFTCGRDITHQKIDSRFCSEKLYGRVAKKCRNKVSNFILRERRYYNGPLLFEVDNFLREEYIDLKNS